MIAIFLKPLILRARSARKIKGFRKMAKVLSKKQLWASHKTAQFCLKCRRSSFFLQFFSLSQQWGMKSLRFCPKNGEDCCVCPRY